MESSIDDGSLPKWVGLKPDAEEFRESAWGAEPGTDFPRSAGLSGNVSTLLIVYMLFPPTFPTLALFVISVR